MLILSTATMGMSTLTKSPDNPLEDVPSDEVPKGKPPSYTEEEQLLLNFPKLNLSDTKALANPTRMVTRDQCVAHLKFLAVLADLRDSVSNNDGLFGITDNQAENIHWARDEARARIREKRWAVYTARAVERYQKWFFTCLPMSRPHVTLSDLEDASYEGILNCETMVVWNEDNLPPLGKQITIGCCISRIALIESRYLDGMAFTYVKPPRLHGGLYSLWKNEYLDNRIPV